MKIVEVNTYTVRPRWGFVEIVTDEGLTGWGEPVLEGHCATVLACVQEMKPYLIGKDPMRIEDFSAVLYRAGFYRGGGVLMSAIAGIDQALWDIKGKFFNAPVYQLMGGACRDNMRVYSWIGGDRPNDVGAAALERKLYRHQDERHRRAADDRHLRQGGRRSGARGRHPGKLRQVFRHRHRLPRPCAQAHGKGPGQEAGRVRPHVH